MKNFKSTLIIIIVVLVILVSIFLLGRYKGKKYVPKEVSLPSDTQPINGGGVSTSFNPGPYTDAIASDVYDFFSLHSSQPYNDVLALSNTQVVAIYNDWNKRYFSKHNETLPAAIKAESTGWNYSWVTATGALITRLTKLGLN
jgi:hypothetical protein